MTAARIIPPSSSIDNRRQQPRIGVGRTQTRSKPLDAAALLARHSCPPRRQSWILENAGADSACDTTGRPPRSAPTRERCGSSGLRSVPAHDRRERVALAREHLQDLRELGLDDQPTLVGRRLAVVSSSGVADLGDQSFAGATGPPARQPAEAGSDVAEQRLRRDPRTDPLRPYVAPQPMLR